MEDAHYDLLKDRIRRTLGVDLEFYKDTQMRRRLDGYVRAKNMEIPAFGDLIARDKDAAKALKDFLTINVSEFFRDTAQFDILRKQIVPRLVANAPNGVTVWSAGASIGAEAYSVAMLLTEAAPLAKHKIIGTDLDEEVIARARAGGPYTKADVRGIPGPFQAKYMRDDEQGPFVVDRVRHMVEFRKHNLLSDTYPRGFDMIMCRNVVIYFTEEAKAGITHRFAESMKPNGVLFIGATEALLQASDFGFQRISTCFYERLPVASRRAA